MTTDHSAQAEDWLDSAGNTYESGASDERAQTEALIGIGHALLASLNPETLEARNIVVPDMRCGTTDDEGRRCTRSALHIMGAAGHHFEDAAPAGL